MSTRLPSLFISHGAPTLALEGGPPAQFLQSLGQELPRPTAIVVASAHWETRQAQLTSAARPETIHDFHGFPRVLHETRYPAPGAPSLAARLVDLLGVAGIEARVNTARGIDHGAWVPLGLMYPAADIPVLQLSLQPQLGPAHHLALGRALLPLREEGVLVLGSGGASHNLRELLPVESPAPQWTRAFVDWLTDKVRRGDVAALLDYAQQAPEAQRNHPTPEHFLPLFVALGAGATHGRVLFGGYSYGALAMTAFAWD